MTRIQLREHIQDLFLEDSEIALFYYAGHGFIDVTGGYLIPSDCKTGNDGLSLNDVMTFANQSKAKNKIIVLDCCHSGIVGLSSTSSSNSELSEGITILSASTADQYATETNGSGIFTTLFVDALNGSAGNLVGDITVFKKELIKQIYERGSYNLDDLEIRGLGQSFLIP